MFAFFHRFWNAPGHLGIYNNSDHKSGLDIDGSNSRLTLFSGATTRMVK